MPKTQPRDLYVPVQGLGDFVAVLKELFHVLYLEAHDHDVQTTVPAAKDGNIGDIIPVQLADGTQLLYVKFSSGWRFFTPT